MRALVTGGAGFIGSAVVALGLNKGWSINVLDNFSTGYRQNLPQNGNVRLIEGDIRERDAVKQALEGVDAVFHLAAHVGNVRSFENPLKDSDVNVLGTLRLLKEMQGAGVKRIVYSSSAAIYGEPRYLPIDEDHICEPDSPYGVSKLAAEKQVLCFGRVYDWQYVGLRYFNVYGVNQRFDSYGNVVPIFADQLINEQPMIIYGNGEQTRDFVNVVDVARANWLALESGTSGVFNVAEGSSTTINALAAIMQSIAPSETTLQYAPSRLGEVRHSVAALGRASQAFSYVPSVKLKAGLAEYLNWMSKRGDEPQQ
jgi:UDP-glucose 4-epimerase